MKIDVTLSLCRKAPAQVVLRNRLTKETILQRPVTQELYNQESVSKL